MTPAPNYSTSCAHVLIVRNLIIDRPDRFSRTQQGYLMLHTVQIIGAKSTRRTSSITSHMQVSVGNEMNNGVGLDTAL